MKKIKDFLAPMNTFNLNSIKVNDGNLFVQTYKNCLVSQALTAEAERRISLNPYARTLKSGKYFFTLHYFPLDISKESGNRECLPTKYKTRLNNLLKAQELGQLKLTQYWWISVKDLYHLKYTAKPYQKREDYDYRDELEDTSVLELIKPSKTYATIERVSLASSTLLILDNAKVNKNKSLYRYLSNSKAFYADCIINYILEHSKIISPENFKYPNPILKVHMPAREFKKLYPSRAKVKMPSGISICYVGKEGRKRLSKKDSMIITFSEEFLTKYKNIIKRSEDNKESPQSFIKVPMFFVLEALKSENLGSNGFQFLLWLLPFFRMKTPKIYHSLRTIMEETGMDTKHGYSKPLKLLQKYFNYMQKLDMFLDVEEPLNIEKEEKQSKQLKLKLRVKEEKQETKFRKLDEPPKYNNKLIQLKKPKMLKKNKKG